MSKSIDMAGQTVNGVKVLHPSDRNDGRGMMWVCVCPHCGGEFVARGGDIRTGNHISCGCANRRNFKDMTGQICGGLEVLRRAEDNTARGLARWVCRCTACGKEVVRTGETLRRTPPHSCGCLNRKPGRKAAEKPKAAPKPKPPRRIPAARGICYNCLCRTRHNSPFREQPTVWSCVLWRDCPDRKRHRESERRPTR